MINQSIDLKYTFDTLKFELIQWQIILMNNDKTVKNKVKNSQKQNISCK
jgi:hypothetical protein